MYKDYIKKIKGETLFVNQDDALVILELKWLNLYDMFNEFVIKENYTEPSAEARALGAMHDRRNDQLYRELGLKPEEGPPGRCAYLAAYVEPYDRFFVFQYYWGYSKPEDNGYSSYNLPATEASFNWVRSSIGNHKFLLVEGPLPVFKSYYHAARKLKGQRLHAPPAVLNYEADDLDTFFADWKKLYNK